MDSSGRYNYIIWDEILNRKNYPWLLFPFDTELYFKFVFTDKDGAERTVCQATTYDWNTKRKVMQIYTQNEHLNKKYALIENDWVDVSSPKFGPEIDVRVKLNLYF